MKHLPKRDCLVQLDDETWVDVEYQEVPVHDRVAIDWLVRFTDGEPIEMERVVGWSDYPAGSSDFPALLPAGGCLLKGHAGSAFGEHWQHCRFESELDRNGPALARFFGLWSPLPEPHE